jgi:hypothetical protein
MTRYGGVDLHRRRSVIVVLDGEGTELWTGRIDNDPCTIAASQTRPHIPRPTGNAVLTDPHSSGMPI